MIKVVSCRNDLDGGETQGYTGVVTVVPCVGVTLVRTRL